MLRHASLGSQVLSFVVDILFLLSWYRNVEYHIAASFNII